MSLLYFAFIVLFLKCFQFSNIPGTEQYERFKAQLLRGETKFSSILTKASQCPALLEKDGELFKLMLTNQDYESYEYLLLISCKDNLNVLEMAVKAAARSTRDKEILSTVFPFLRNYSGSNSRRLSKIMFEECARNRNYDCIAWFGEDLCRVTDQEGRNILHLAAQEDDATLFNEGNVCKLLINEKDFEGKYPMEHAKSKELAQKFNDKWIEVAKEHFLALESSSRIMELGARFQIESDEAPTQLSETENRIHFEEAFRAGIESVEDVYCPYLKMKLNLLDGKGHDKSGMILEWLSYLLNDIFSSMDSIVVDPGTTGTEINVTKASDTIDPRTAGTETINPETSGAETIETETAGIISKETIDIITAPLPDLFTKSETTDEYIPTGKYTKEVYEFVGKVLAIANYFGLGHNIKITEDSAFSETLKAIQIGADSMKFLRLETHEIEEDKVLVLKGRDVFVKIFIYDEVSSYFRYVIDFKCINYFITAFENLSDYRKMKFISLILDENEIKDGAINVELNNMIKMERGDHYLRKKQKEIQFRKYENLNEYEDAFKRITK